MTAEALDLPDLNFPGPWVRDALCAQVDADLFFPEKGGTPYPAKRVCRTCPVAAECLEYALTSRERFGVFGGKTPNERAAIIRAGGHSE